MKKIGVDLKALSNKLILLNVSARKNNLPFPLSNGRNDEIN